MSPGWSSGRPSRRKVLGIAGGAAAVGATGLTSAGVLGFGARPANAQVAAQTDVTITVNAGVDPIPIVNPAGFVNQSLAATVGNGLLPAGVVEDLRNNFDIRLTRVFLNPSEGPAEHSEYLDQVVGYSDRVLVCYNGLPGKPTDQVEEWEDLVRVMLLDHKARYPTMEYIEPWNEPNLVADGIPPAAYYAYYKASCRAVQEVNAQLDPDIPLKVGGPVTTRGIGADSYIEDFLDLYAADGDASKQLDFVSYHDYGSISAPRRVRSWRSTIRGWLSARGIPVVPVFVTEYGAYGGGSGTDDFRADRLVQAACMAAMGRYYTLNRTEAPMHWALDHASNDRKDIYVNGTERSRTPYGNVVAMQALQKAGRVSTGFSPAVDDNGIGVGGISTIDTSGLAVLFYNYQAQAGTENFLATVNVQNLPPALATNRLRLRRFLVDTAHNNYDYDQTVVGLSADHDEVVEPTGTSVTHSTELEPNAVGLLVVEPLPLRDIYLLIGQSNMAGRAQIQSQDLAAPLGVSLFNADDEWEPAANQPYGLNRYSTLRKELSLQRLGPGHAFARRLSAETGTNLGLVVNARGATTVSNWRRTDHTGDFPLYDEAVTRAAAALAATPGGRIAGIIWHQGEGDNNERAVDYYLPTLADIVDGLRTELDAPGAVFVAGEVGVWNGRGQHINPLIRQVPDVIDNAAWVSSEGLTSLNLANNDPHFDSASQRILGARYADAVLALL